MVQQIPAFMRLHSKILRVDFAGCNTPLKETCKADLSSVSFKMVNTNIMIIVIVAYVIEMPTIVCMNNVSEMSQEPFSTGSSS